MIARLCFAALDRLRSVPRSTWSSFASGGVIGWVAVAALTDAPMTRPVAVGFMLCVVIAVCLCIAIGVVLVRSDEHAERLVHLEIRAERLPELPAVVLPEDETTEADRGDWYAKLKAGAEWVDARMQPTFLEPEPATEPVPVVRPSPVPREPAPLITEPMEIGDELAADAHAYVVRESEAGELDTDAWLAEQRAWLAEQMRP